MSTCMYYTWQPTAETMFSIISAAVLFPTSPGCISISWSLRNVILFPDVSHQRLMTFSVQDSLPEEHSASSVAQSTFSASANDR